MGILQNKRTDDSSYFLAGLARVILIATWGALAIFTINPAAATPISATDFHARVISVYDFQPHTIGKEAFPAKSAQLDEFWTFVKTHEQDSLPLLRGELGNAANPSFFYYDGAKLLLSLSKEKADHNSPSVAFHARTCATSRSLTTSRPFTGSPATASTLKKPPSASLRFRTSRHLFLSTHSLLARTFH